MDLWVLKKKWVPDDKNMFNLPVLLFNAFPMHTRLSGTVVGSRQTQMTVSAGWAQAVESVDLFNTGSSTLTRVRTAFFDLNITFISYQRMI